MPLSLSTAADTIIRYYLADAGKSPRIIGLLAYDTPYYGLHDQVQPPVFVRYLP